MADWFSATAVRQVLVEELGDGRFVDPVQPKTLAAHPPRKVRDAVHVTGDGVRRVPAVGQVPLERNVRPELPISKPVEVVATRTMNCAHGGLLKWDRHCTRTPKLCLGLRRCTPVRLDELLLVEVYA
jgi:hypothetical protein